MIRFLVCLECGIAERVSLKLLYFIGYFVYVIGCTVNFFVQQVVVNIAMCFTCKFFFEKREKERERDKQKNIEF